MTCDRPSIAALLAGAAWLMVAADAAARADDKGQARQRLDEGSALYRDGDYQGALRKFEEAQALYPSPNIYFNLGQSLSRLGRTAAAVDAFEKFLELAPRADPARRRDADRFLIELRPRVGHLRVVASGGSEIAIDGRAVGVAPLTRAVPVDPGPHQVTARVPGSPLGHVGRVEVAAGQSVEWEAVLPSPAAVETLFQPPLADPTPAVTPRPAPAAAVSTSVVAAGRQPRRWWPWVAGGAAVAAAVVAIVLVTRDPAAPMGSLGSASWPEPRSP